MKNKNNQIEIFEKIRNWAKKNDIIKKISIEKEIIKLYEEIGELSESFLHDKKDEFEDAIGDIIVVLTNIATMSNTTIEQCIFKAYDEIIKRKYVKEIDYEKAIKERKKKRKK